MNVEMQYNSLSDLPDLIKEYVLGEPVAAFNRAMIDKFVLNDEQQRSLLRIESALVERAIFPEEVPSEIMTSIGLDEDSAYQLSEKIWNEYCGSIRWYFPDLAEIVADVGKTLPPRNPFAVVQPKVTVSEAIGVIQKLIDDIPERVKKPVLFYIENILQNQRVDQTDFVARLGNSVSHGGCGLSSDRVQKVWLQIKNYLGVYKFTDLVPQVDPTTIPKDILEQHEAADIAATQPAAVSVSKSFLSAQQESLVTAVLEAESLHDRGPELQERWKMIVEARIGGARDAAKTQALLTTSTDGGGLGLQFDEAQRLATLLEQTAAGFEKRREEFSVMEKIASVQRSTAGIVAGPEAVQRETQKELNQRFVSMFGKDAVEEIRRETHREIESSEMAHPGEEARSHIAPIQFTQPQQMASAVVVPLPPSTPTVPPQIVPSQEPKYVPKVPDKLRQLIDAEAPVLPMKPKTADAPQIKKASDIKAGPRLVGPVDELRIMTLVDFRRLSPDVSVRIQKIRSKIDVIGRDGPHEKIRAVQAVEQSEPMRLYRDLLKRSLISQRSIQELSAEQKNSKQPYLEPEEISALAQFLTQIRYSSL